MKGLDDMGDGRANGLDANALRLLFLLIGVTSSGDGFIELVGRETTPKLEPDGEKLTSVKGEPKADLRIDVGLNDAGSKELYLSMKALSSKSSKGECFVDSGDDDEGLGVGGKTRS